MSSRNSNSDKASLEKVKVDAVDSASSEKRLGAPEEELGETPPTLTPEQERRLYRKIDLRLLPTLTLVYLFAFLDRSNIGNAKLQGLTTQLDLTGNKFNIALTMFFIPYCLFECPANLVLKKFRPARWLPGITIVWGIIMTLMSLVKTYPSLVGTRILLGVAEAGLFPGVAYYLTLWYPRNMLQLRVGIFWGGATIAGAFSGLLAFGISFLSGKAGLLGWSWIFLIEGLATITVGIFAYLMLVDFPSTAKFLTPEERAFVIWRKKYDNSSVGEEEDFAFKEIWSAFADWQVWVHVMIYMAIITPVYGITLFLPSIINGFGFTTAISQLLTVPPYFCATLLGVLFAVLSDRMMLRWPFVLAGYVLCLVGFVINISDVAIGVKYFGTFLIVMGSYAGFPAVIAWLGNNLSGQYKRGVGMACQIGIGNFGGAIASNIYRTQDAPRYKIGHGIEIMFVCIGILLIPPVLYAYKKINARKEARLREMTEQGIVLSPKELRALGDRAADFKYTM